MLADQPRPRPERCPFCGAGVSALYTLEVTPTHGARFEEVERWLICGNDGIIAAEPVDGTTKFATVHPPGVKPANPAGT